MTEAAFKRAFNGACRYLGARYGIKYTAVDGKADRLFIDKAGDESTLFEYYYNAVQNYIEHTYDKTKERYADFTDLAEASFKSVWREKNKAVNIRGCRF